MKAYQVRVTYLDGEEDVNTFYTQEEAQTAYEDQIRLNTEQDIACDIELIEVLAQARIKGSIELR